MEFQETTASSFQPERRRVLSAERARAKLVEWRAGKASEIEGFWGDCYLLHDDDLEALIKNAPKLLNANDMPVPARFKQEVFALLGAKKRKTGNEK